MNRLVVLILAGTLAIVTGCTRDASVPDGGPVQHVGGYTLYFGVVPSAIAAPSIGAHSPGPRDAHGLARGDYPREHHLLVVAERMSDGRRPESAEVTASAPIAGATVQRRLAPMAINGAMSYGAVFVLPGPGTYAFTTTLRIPGEPAPVVARFIYRQAHDPRP